MSSMLGYLIGGSGEDFPAIHAPEAANRFRPRADGGFDYFPEGVRKPGYCVDHETRDRIMRLERGLDGLFVGLIAVLVLILLAAAPLLSRVFPLARLWLTLGGGVILTIALQIARRGARRMTRDLLRDAPPAHVMPDDDYRDYRALMVRRWKEMPRLRMLRNLSLLFGPAIFVTAIAAGEISVQGWPRIVFLGLAVVFWVGILQLVFEIIRVWLWSRALR